MSPCLRGEFGVTTIDVHARPPFGFSEEKALRARGIALPYVQLETYFDVLAVPTREGSYEQPRPVIYEPHPPPAPAESPEVLKVGLASIFTDLHDVKWEGDSTRFWGARINDARIDLVRRRLAWVLRTAVAEGINLLVLPELNLDADLAEQFEHFWARERGPDLMVAVVGLTHRAEENGSGYRNAPLVFTGAGPLSWPYWKHDAVQFPFPEGMRVEALGDGPQYVAAIDTPLGRLCVVICKDALHHHVQDAVYALRASLLVVPSMTSWTSTDDFMKFAQTVAAANHGVMIFCNSAVHVRGQGNAAMLGFVHPSIRHRRDGIPSHSLPHDEAQATLAVYSLPASHRIAAGESMSMQVRYATELAG